MKSAIKKVKPSSVYKRFGLSKVFVIPAKGQMTAYSKGSSIPESFALKIMTVINVENKIKYGIYSIYLY